MNLPPPERGDVIRYSYLWADERAHGLEEGRKDRPAVVIALSVQATKTETRILVVAVTHTPPRDRTAAVPFPADLKRSIGLDDSPAWIVTTEGNAFVWPGPDIRPVPRRRPRTFVYGRVSPNLLQQIAASYLANRNRQRARIVSRTV